MAAMFEEDGLKGEVVERRFVEQSERLPIIS